MAGSLPQTSSAESIVDGAIMDTETVPDFRENVAGNCLVTVNETTLISFGGDDQTERRIAVLNIGDSEWTVGG